MAKMTVAEAERNLVRTVERVAGERERVTLTSDGKPVAAIVPAEDLELLEALEDRLDVEEARRALTEDGPSVAWEKVKAELGL
jgi:prevent-host-death family protein